MPGRPPFASELREVEEARQSRRIETPAPQPAPIRSVSSLSQYAEGSVRARIIQGEHNSIPTDALIRMRIKTELSRLGDALDSWPHADQMATLLRDWHGRFFQAIQLPFAEASTTHALFLDQLQRILIDPIRRAPLDERAVLGSDGVTYGYKALCLYLAMQPNTHCSPLDPTSKTLFTTIPHDGVAATLRWLNVFGGAQYDVQVESEFLDLERHNQVPALPTIESESLRLRTEQQECLRSKNADRLNAFRQQFRVASCEISQYLSQSIDAVHDLHRTIAQEQGRQLDEIEENDTQMTQAVQKRLSSLDTEIHALQFQIDALEQQIRTSNVAVSQAQKENIRVQILLKETEKTLAEREKGWGKAILSTVVMIGGCALGTCLFQGALSMGSIAMSPVKSGFGGMITFHFPI
jgi:hypothetical protein